MLKKFNNLYEQITKRIAGKQYKYYKHKNSVYILDDEYNVMAFGDIQQYYNKEYKNLPLLHMVINAYGYGFGDLIFSLASSLYGKLIPSSAESDLSKKGWLKRFNNKEWSKEKIDGIGYYKQSDDYMNNIYELKDKSPFKMIDINTLNDDIQIKVKKQISDLHDDLLGTLIK